jgi:hypothetical protein
MEKKVSKLSKVSEGELGKLGSWEDEKLRSTSRSALHFFLGKKTLKKIFNCQLLIVNC